MSWGSNRHQSCSSSSEDEDDERVYDDDGLSEENEDPVVSLFDEFCSNSAEDVWRFMCERICLINFLRKKQMENFPTVHLIPTLADIKDEWNQEQFLIPTKPNDRLLWEVPENFQSSEIQCFQHNGEEADQTLKNTSRISLQPMWSGQKFAQQIYSCKPLRCDFSDDMLSASWIYPQNDFTQHTRSQNGSLDDASVYEDFVSSFQETLRRKTILCIGCSGGTLATLCVKAGALLSVGLCLSSFSLEAAERRRQEWGGENLFFFGAPIHGMTLWKVKGKNEAEENKIIACFGDTGVPEDAQPFKCDVLLVEWVEKDSLWGFLFNDAMEAYHRFCHGHGIVFPRFFVLEMSTLAKDAPYSTEEAEICDEDGTGIQILGIGQTSPKPLTKELRQECNVMSICFCLYVVAAETHTLMTLDLHKVELLDSMRFVCPFILKHFSPLFSCFILRWIPLLPSRHGVLAVEDLSYAERGPQHTLKCDLQAFQEDYRREVLKSNAVHGKMIMGGGDLSLSKEVSLMFELNIEKP